MERQELKKELDATLDARRELGSEYESALVDSFVDKVDVQLRRRLAEERLAARGDRRAASSDTNFGERFGFAVITLVLAIPLSAIAAVQAGFKGLLVAWAGIVAVNFVHATKSFRPRGE
ncbi:hypothetical protein ACWGCI_16350 [Streptomyces sp. NPDC054949]|uniref:hypothetical protein n=1 Tax=unclassified Streptomyces TaxID=2593676 RepID=UPI0006AF94B4|nr:MULTISPECIES: hypothetical protein [unclassified Streptomyces]KOU44877.1 membrane protein [Streptomyces sp. WM4235]MCX5075052.1 hypothetical protein [Streptomyces sp. NBC_00424]MCX5153331.1 hypothetical protein [Streptomyces sp. NBC_00291]WUD41800.1 hypothetical protein OHA84_15520 [Streptomyces sp. NBC_00513]